MLVNEIILYYDARSQKNQIFSSCFSVSIFECFCLCVCLNNYQRHCTSNIAFILYLTIPCMFAPNLSIVCHYIDIRLSGNFGER